MLSACGGNVKVAMPLNPSAEQKIADHKAAVRTVKASVADVPSHFLLAVKGHVENELSARMFAEQVAMALENGKPGVN